MRLSRLTPHLSIRKASKPPSPSLDVQLELLYGIFCWKETQDGALLVQIEAQIVLAMSSIIDNMLKCLTKIIFYE